MVLCLGIACHPTFRVQVSRFASHHLARAQDDFLVYAETRDHVDFFTRTPLGLSVLTIAMFVMFSKMIRTCRGVRPGHCGMTQDRVRTMPRLYSDGRYENKMRARLNKRRIKSGM